ncbi:MAG: universal stress protein [Rhizobiales bacterium]|nr:universal stress protein [Hyphomicrobiales bacterium]MBN9079782.1 universal stress protein [Hyphomicrobiales bacterium]
MYNHILIPTDGSDLAQRGVDQGLSLAKQLGSRVTILIATERLPFQDVTMYAGWVGAPADYEGYEDVQKRFANDILSAAKAEATKLGISANTVHVPDAHPATAILETATSVDCDLIVMASHGRRGVQRLLLGSQTAEVLANSHTAVLVVR